MLNSQEILDLMIQSANSSGTIIRANFRKSSLSENKSSHIDIVTETDFASQKNIHDSLITGMTKLGINTEEIGFVEEESHQDDIKIHNFIVDPIDGTTNFSSGIPFCCISIAYALNHNITIGVVFDPFSNTLFWGMKGEGSFVESELFGKKELRLQVKPMKSWIVGAHLNGLDVVADQFSTYQKLYPEVRGLRNIGSLTLDLCLMADDVFDVILNKGCYFWDLAAASVILREAGGNLYDYSGKALTFDWTDTKKMYHIIACHPEIINKAMSFVT